MMNTLWVVEVQWENEWQTTVGVGLTRADGRRELKNWQHRNPCDQFRLVQYKRRPWVWV